MKTIVTRAKLLNVLVAVASLVVVAVGATSLVAPQQAHAAAGPGPRFFDACKKEFFGLRPWYYYMNREFHYLPAYSNNQNTAAPCDIKCFNIFPQAVANECNYKSSDIPGVLLVIIDDLLRVAGVVATAFVIVGAFQFVTSQSNPEQTARARSTLINALAGLAVALVAIGFVDFVLSRLVN